MEIVGYIESDLDGFVDARKSTSSYIFMFAGVRYPGRVKSKLWSPLLLCMQSLLLVMLLSLMLFS